MWSRDMEIRLYLHDKSLRWSDWLLGEIFVAVGGFYSSFFVASQINRHKYCMLNANLFMYSELYFQFGNVVTDAFINDVFIPYKYCTCAGSRLFVTGLTPSGRWNLNKEEDIGTYFTSMTSSRHRELKIKVKKYNKLHRELTRTGSPILARKHLHIYRHSSETFCDRKCLALWDCPST